MTCHDLGLLLIGFALGIIGNLVAWQVSAYYERKNQRKIFSLADGKYVGYRLEPNSELLNYDASSCEATIRYKEVNLLTIDVVPSDGSPSWDGDIAMHTRRSGQVTWKENNSDVTKHRFGSKGFIVREGRGKDGKPCVHVYLIGDASEGFGKEVLERSA